MPERKINLEEILSHYVDTSDGYISDFSGESFCPTEAIECAMREFGKQLLELASENAKIYTDTMCSPYSEDWVKYVDKQSIIDTIKQVK